MKKILIAILVGLSLTLTACGTKLEVAKINASDSIQTKQCKEVYNLKYNTYTNDPREKFIEYLEKEAKMHPKDNLQKLIIRCSANYLDFEGDKTAEMIQGFFKNSLKHMGGSVESCLESEYKNAEKIKRSDMEKVSKDSMEVTSLCKGNEELTKFNKSYVDASKSIEELMGYYPIGTKTSGEEFLKSEPSKKFKEVMNNRRIVLLEMKKKIDNMK